MRLRYGTNWVTADEPCLGLQESNLQSPDSRGFHRYQIIYVMRGDKPAEYKKDLGLKTKADQFNILGGAKDEITGRFYIEHTVGELRDIANQRRGNDLFDKRELAQVNNIKE